MKRTMLFLFSLLAAAPALGLETCTGYYRHPFTDQGFKVTCHDGTTSRELPVFKGSEVRFLHKMASDHFRLQAVTRGPEWYSQVDYYYYFQRD